MTPKRPILFSILALTLACLLLNASIIQVSGVAPIVIILAIVGSAIGGVIGGYFLHDFMNKQSQAPGVNLDTYVLTVSDSWETGAINMGNYLQSLANNLNWAKEYYGKWAANIAGNYLDKESLDPYEQEIMRDIAYDIYAYYENSTIKGLYNFANELRRFAKERLTGDLDDYKIYLGSYVNVGGAYTGNAWLRYTSEILPVYRYEGSFKAWIFGSVTVGFVDADGDSSPDGYGTWKFVSLFDNKTYTVDVTSSAFTIYSIPEGIYEISFSGSNTYNGIIAMYNLLVISDTSHLNVGFAAKFDTIRYGNCFEVWKLGSKLKGIDLTNVWNAVRNIINNLDAIYDAAYNNARVKHQTCRELGYTDPSQADACILPAPTVVAPTLQDLYENYTQNFEELLAYYLAYLQKLNETFAKTDASLIQLIDQMNLTFADVREKLLNVVIRDLNGSVWAVVDELIPLWVSQAQEFYANATNTLQGVIGALVKFQNGTWRYVEIPAGWSLQPATIVTPSGETPSLLLQNWAGGVNPAYTPSTNQTQPEFVTPASETLTTTLQLVLAIIPLVLILAVVNMLVSLGKRR